MTRRAALSDFLLDRGSEARADRAILFVPLTVFVVMPLLGRLLDAILGPQQPGPFRLDPAHLALAEAFNFACGLVVVGLFALYKHRRIDSYGMPLGDALKSPTLEGWIVGVAQTAVVALSMYAYGAMQVHGLALSGLRNRLVCARVAWSVHLHRGSRGIPLSWLFFADPVEGNRLLARSWRCCRDFRRSSLFAEAGRECVGYVGTDLVQHSLLLFRIADRQFVVRGRFPFRYDFMQFFVIGTPNGGQLPVGRFLDATFNGPAWLTGGPLGTEANWFAVPLDALAFLYIWRRFRRKPAFQPQ